MGIYIPGMEMPTRCWDCPCSDKSNGVCEAIVDGAPIWDDRLAWCPLVLVPPHGDLIERKACCLTDFEIAMCGGDYKEGMKMLSEKIESAPVIIPAEEEE